MQAFPIVAPRTAGFAADLDQRLDAAIGEGRFAGLHCALVLRAGKQVLERYVAGNDEVWGRPLGKVTFNSETLHDLRSVSKSIVSLLYGIALAKAQVPDLDTPLVSSFPHLADLALDRERRAMTVGHALGMTLGIEWNEDLPYTDPNNDEIAMEHAPERIRFVLGRPIREPPGTRWRYCGGATAVIAELLRRGTGMELAQFAQQQLFAPLDIHTFEWTEGSDGHGAAASGLRLSARDLARIGQLVLDGGEANGIQIVPRAWLEQSLTPYIQIDHEVAYGLHWWSGHLLGGGERWWSANGNGGQRLFIVPSLGIVTVILCGNYNQAEHWRIPIQIISDFVLQSLVE